MRLVIRQALLLAAKDTRVFTKDRFAMGFAFLFPLMFVLGFTVAFGSAAPEDEQLRFTVATFEEDGISNEIIAGMTSSAESGIDVMSYEDAQRALDDGEIEGFVAFPGDFTARLLKGEPTAIEVVADSDSPNIQAALHGLAQAIASQISHTHTAVRAIVQLQGTSAGAIPGVGAGMQGESQSLIDLETEKVGDVEPFKPGNFTVPGYLTMFVFFAAAMSASAIAKERQIHTLERLMSNGVRRESVIVGKFLGACYIGLMQLTVLWVVGILGFGVDLGAAPVAVILISLLMVLASAGFAVMLASMVKTERSAGGAGVLASLTLAPIGGCWWPLFITPLWMRTLARFTPHGWANTGFNKLMLFGADFGDVALEMVALAVFAAVFVIIALLRFRLAPGR